MNGGKRFSATVLAGDDSGAAIVAALRAAEGFAAASHIAQPLGAKLLVVVEELVANVCRHGRAGRDVELVLELGEEDGGVRIALEDTGIAFDPSSAPEFHGPDMLTGGGVGLELVRRWASEMSHARDGKRNRLRLLLR